MIFLKSLAGGIVSVIFVWIIIVAIYMWHVTLMSRQQANTGPIAVAAGWDYLLHRPLIVVLLAATFGFGVYLTAMWVGSH
jgi:hypothetical protein